MSVSLRDVEEIIKKLGKKNKEFSGEDCIYPIQYKELAKFLIGKCGGRNEENTETPNPEFEAKQDKIVSRNFYSIRAKFYDMFKISGDFGDEDMIRIIFEKLANLEVKNV
jgi:hypothetical protein